MRCLGVVSIGTRQFLDGVHRSFGHYFRNHPDVSRTEVYLAAGACVSALVPHRELAAYLSDTLRYELIDVADTNDHPIRLWPLSHEEATQTYVAAMLIGQAFREAVRSYLAYFAYTDSEGKEQYDFTDRLMTEPNPLHSQLFQGMVIDVMGTKLITIRTWAGSWAPIQYRARTSPDQVHKEVWRQATRDTVIVPAPHLAITGQTCYAVTRVRNIKLLGPILGPDHQVQPADAIVARWHQMPPISAHGKALRGGVV